MDCRSYEVAVDILRILQIESVQLMTNNPGKIKALERKGINVADRIPLIVEINVHNGAYMQAMKHKMNHLL